MINLDLHLVKGIGVEFFLGGTLFLMATKKLKMRAKVEDTPTSKLRSAAQGLVEAEGNAWPQSLELVTNLKSELSVYRHRSLQKKIKQGKGHKWQTIHENFFNRPFYLFDDSGVALVFPDSATLDCKEVTCSWMMLPSQVRENYFAGSPTPDFFSSLPTSMIGSIFSQNYRVVEKSIIVGSPIYIQGEFKTTTQTHPIKADLKFKEFFSRVTQLRKNNTIFKQRLDQDHDGEVSKTEAESGIYSLATTILNRKVTNPLVASKYENINIINYGQFQKSENHELIIANCYENELLKILRSPLIYLLLFLGVGLVGHGIYNLLKLAQLN